MIRKGGRAAAAWGAVLAVLVAGFALWRPALEAWWLHEHGLPPEESLLS